MSTRQSWSNTGSNSVAGTDWKSFHRRIEASRRAVADSGRVSEARRQAILDERARRTAQAPVEESREAAFLELVTFQLGEERYGIERRYVRAVLRMTDDTPLPGAPPYFVGVVNFQSEVVSVLDLGQLFGLAPRGIGELNTLLVLQRGNVQFGILADALAGLDRVSDSTLALPASSFTEKQRALVRGISDSQVVVLNANRLLVDQWTDAGPPSIHFDSESR